jgi:hypothetical protein
MLARKRADGEGRVKIPFDNSAVTSDGESGRVINRCSDSRKRTARYPRSRTPETASDRGRNPNAISYTRGGLGARPESSHLPRAHIYNARVRPVCAHVCGLHVISRARARRHVTTRLVVLERPATDPCSLSPLLRCPRASPVWPPATSRHPPNFQLVK